MTVLRDTPIQNKRTSDIPGRFQTARFTLWVDRFMNHFIKAGGLGIIAAVMGIFIFIFLQTIPLFQGARVEEIGTLQFPPDDYECFGVDEWVELPYAATKTGILRFLNVETGAVEREINVAAETGKKFTAVRQNLESQEILFGTDGGEFLIADLQYTPVYEGQKRKIEAEVRFSDVFAAGGTGPVIDISYSDHGERKLAAVLQGEAERREVRIVTFSQARSLMGAGKVELNQTFDLTPQIKGVPEKVMVNSQADSVLVTTQAGDVYFFYYTDEEMDLRQVFRPFSALPNPAIASIDYLLGSVSVVLTHESGLNEIYSLYVPEGGKSRMYGKTKTFEPVPGGATYYDASLRNKAFLIGRENFVSLRYATSESVRWQTDLPFTVYRAALGRKYDRMLFLENSGTLHIYRLTDPHPESGFHAFFQKNWYEGYSKPTYEWQSTGGTDDFEAKLSLVPLMIGTLKGTLYAMFFALPVALIAALYTAQFAHPRFKLFVKPAMEVMASLPSVVLGFLAALWLAPLIENRVPSMILIVLFLPAAAFMFGDYWTRLPLQRRNLIRSGYEWVAMVPILLLVCWAGWHLGPVLERAVFFFHDPETGARIADFRLWWPHVTGTPFEQRNSLVVGFMMAFAVIPIIFTIAEDALSNVPKTLTSGSLALGASRWQTAMRVVLPTAYPGIFSAVMVGLGRAVGETMIVVMATGNTPIMDFNIFSGMRTLSANIAVELPEAPYLGTLYRTLFFGAMVLFLMTFMVNTAAEVIRQRLREKYRTV